MKREGKGWVHQHMKCVGGGGGRKRVARVVWLSTAWKKEREEEGGQNSPALQRMYCVERGRGRRRGGQNSPAVLRMECAGRGRVRKKGSRLRDLGVVGVLFGGIVRVEFHGRSLRMGADQPHIRMV